ncbi:MAG TPA: PIN domain-containing protein, partial [Ktedonobacteraceae bacterium]|nr:PIN domain-containing protein [Ktedonobacteraceae bacterium]
AGAISRQKGDSKLARQVIKDIYYYDAMRILTLKDTLMWASVEIAADLQLRAGDTTYIAVAHQYRLPLVSWDKEQLRKASSLTTTYTPDEYPF